MITQQPTKAPLEELQAIELLQKVMLGNEEGPLPKNSVQQHKVRQIANPAPAPKATAASPTSPENYMSNDEDDDVPAKPRRSRRVQRRIHGERQPEEGNSLHRIVALAAKATATVPPLAVDQRKLTRGFQVANLNLQLDEWAYKTYFVGAILEEETGRQLEYRDLVKHPEIREQ